MNYKPAYNLYWPAEHRPSRVINHMTSYKLSSLSLMHKKAQKGKGRIVSFVLQLLLQLQYFSKGRWIFGFVKWETREIGWSLHLNNYIVRPTTSPYLYFIWMIQQPWNNKVFSQLSLYLSKTAKNIIDWKPFPIRVEQN